MQQKKKESHKIGYFLLSLPILLLVLWLGFSASGAQYTALLALGLYAPADAVEIAEGYWGQTPAALKQEEANHTEESVSRQAQYANQAQDAPQAAQKNSALTETPADIKAIMAKAQSDTAGLAKVGAIVEADYRKAGQTAVFGNVRVKNSTETKSLNIEKVLQQKLDMAISDKKKPAVLIVHTHATESYQMVPRDYYVKGENGRSNREDNSVIRVGTEIAKQLENAGFQVIHDKTVHDTSYSGAYYRCEDTIQKHLKENPQIQVVLDVHRDAMHQSNGNKIKPVATIEGKKAAQVMIITGAEEGSITDFPDWEKNLQFSLHLQEQMERMYPGLTRPVMFCQRIYTQNLHPQDILLEMGTDANTLEEAVYAGRLVGNALAGLLEKYVSQK